MKKTFMIFIIAALFVTGCSNKKNANSSNQKAVTETNNTVDNKNTNISENPFTEIPTNIDIDFTKMNYNMTSSVIFEMMTEPEKYIDKNIKIEGQFNTSIYEGKQYFAVLNWDLTGCCPTGLNFIPPNSMTYPKDFPEEGDFITVIGTMKVAFDGESDSLCFFATSITPKVNSQ